MSNRRTIIAGDKDQGFSFAREDGSPLNIKELPRSNYALAFKLKDGTVTHQPLKLLDDGCMLVYEGVIPDYATHVQVVLTWNDGNNVLMGGVIDVE